MPNELIYCVEDDEHIEELLKYNLESAGYRVLVFESGELLLEQMNSVIPDLFCLDVMLPGMDGFDVCKIIRENPKTRNVPIIMITAKSEEADILTGLELGADYYISKPFSMRELLSRIRALFRRAGMTLVEETSKVLKYYDITIDTIKHKVFKGKQEVELSIKEFNLLILLIQNKGKVLTRKLLLDKVWAYDYVGETRTVDVHIHFLRQKIEQDENKPELIETVRGIGYRLKE